MFDTHFPFRYINSIKKITEEGEGRYIEFNYSFRGASGKRYIVVVELYEFNCYVVKFHLQEHKNYQDKFRQATMLKECSRVITTVVYIMMQILVGNPYANFGFIGSPGMQEDGFNNTKRFRTYTKIMDKKMTAVPFDRHYNNANSSCLFMNRNNDETDLLIKIENMFTKYYPSLIIANA